MLLTRWCESGENVAGKKNFKGKQGRAPHSLLIHQGGHRPLGECQLMKFHSILSMRRHEGKAICILLIWRCILCSFFVVYSSLLLLFAKNKVLVLGISFHKKGWCCIVMFFLWICFKQKELTGNDLLASFLHISFASSLVGVSCVLNKKSETDFCHWRFISRTDSAWEKMLKPAPLSTNLPWQTSGNDLLAFGEEKGWLAEWEKSQLLVIDHKTEWKESPFVTTTVLTNPNHLKRLGQSPTDFNPLRLNRFSSWKPL